MSDADAPGDGGSGSGPRALAVAAGGRHTCAMLEDGVICWGANEVGQLGAGHNEMGRAPMRVALADPRAIVAGSIHTCAIDGDDRLWCWGARTSGVGDGSDSPAVVLEDVADVAAGPHHGCALRRDGTVWCWGEAPAEAMGATTSPQWTPVEMALPEGIEAVEITAGEYHSCLRTESGRVFCWGQASQLGSDATEDTATPVEVTGLSDVVQVTAGYHYSCALLDSGQVWCWGLNWRGQLGDGTTSPSVTPVHVAALPNDVAEVDAGTHHTCARTTSGEVWCWGRADAGQLGVESPSMIGGPAAIPGLSGTRTVSAGGMWWGAHTCAIDAEGAVQCWGWAGWGQLGNAPARIATEAVTVIDAGAMAIGAGGEHSCLVQAEGAMTCWGWNDDGALGTGDFLLHRAAPDDAVSLDPVTMLDLGTNHTCAVASNGGWCWGRGDSGQLGNSSDSYQASPVGITAPDADGEWQRLSAGDEHTCGIWSEGSAVYCWGSSEEGALASSPSTAAPVAMGVDGAADVAAGESFTCAIVGGEVRCWGSGEYGQLGNGVYAMSSMPVTVEGVEPATDVEAGEDHACAIVTGAGVRCWGQNYYGELGHGPTSDPQADARAAVPGTSGALGLAVGEEHTCAIVADGGVHCWGRNAFGQLGRGMLSWAESASAAVEGVQNAVEITATGHHTCAREESGAVKCWGLGAYGQLGDGTRIVEPTPVPASLVTL